MLVRQPNYKVFFVETPSPEENCFVIATNRSSAAKFERDASGFGDHDCNATYVRDLNADWVNDYLLDYPHSEESIAWYLYEGHYENLGIFHTMIDGDDIFIHDDKVFYKQGDRNYLGKIATNVNSSPHKIVIRSVVDLLEILKRDAPGEWIYRGQSSCFWPLKAGIHRFKADEASNIDEKGFLTEFKRRCRLHLDQQPNSEWEWLMLAQHYGLPTRLLDWSQNPLVALYFACEAIQAVPCDGMFFAYRHGQPYFDAWDSIDPFSIKHTVVLRPPHLDQRIIAQRSLFTAEPPRDDIAVENSKILFWNVSGNAKKNVLKELNLLGIDQSYLFPGISSVAADLAALLWVDFITPPKGAGTKHKRKRRARRPS